LFASIKGKLARVLLGAAKPDIAIPLYDKKMIEKLSTLLEKSQTRNIWCRYENQFVKRWTSHHNNRYKTRISIMTINEAQEIVDQWIKQIGTVFILTS